MILTLVRLGVPNQSTTDCGSETTGQSAFANALQLGLSINQCTNHNIVIEKGWWRLHTLWGDNIIAFFEGIKEGIYNIQTPGHQYVLLIYLGALRVLIL